MRKKDNKRKNGDVNLILFSHVNAFGSGNTINTGSQKNEPDNAGIIEDTPAEEQSGLERQKPKGRIRTFLFNAFSHIHFFSDNSFGGKDKESQENGSTSESMPREKRGTTVKVGLASDAHFLSDNKINITIGARKKYLKELADNMDKRFDELERNYPMKVVDAVVTKFEEDIIPKFVKEVVDETGNKITEMQTTIKEWHDKSEDKINTILDEVATIVAGQEAQGKDLKELLKNKEKQDEINRRLDLYMTSTEKTIAENTAQLKNVEKMLLLKEEKDREHFDAVKKGIEGLAKNNDEIKGKIGGLLKEETAFQEFQKLWDHNNYIKQQNDDIKQQNDYIKTLLINLADNVYKQDEDKKNKIDKINSVISNLEDKLTTLNDNIKNAIAASDAKLLGMIMPEIANLKDQNDQILINQETQTTILNSILSGQQDGALQYVAMSEKLDNLTELVSAFGTKTNEHSFADNANKLLENFAKSQEAMFAAAFEKVVKKDDLKHLDTGIDSIIEKLHDDSVKLDEVCAVVENMANKIDSIAQTSENNSQKLDDIHKILLSSRVELSKVALDNVADCDRCHSADSMFYKCQICGNEGRTNVSSNDNHLAFDQTNEESRLIIIRPRNNGNIIIIDNSIENSSPRINKNNVEQIIFDACFRGQNKCNEKRCADCEKCSKDCQKDNGKCEQEVKIELYDKASEDVAETTRKKNLLDYFPNLKVVSFAKPLDGKPKYILTSKLFYDTTKGKVHTSLTYYGGQYIKSMEKSVFNIKDKKTGQKFLEDIGGRDLHYRITADNSKNNGDGYWRLPYKSIEE